MKQTKCPDCGAVYAANEHSCPTCGCPNDNYQPQQDEQRPEVSAETATMNSNEDDFNEKGQYSPLSPTSWFFKNPWPLNNYPERKMFEKAHPLLGWLFGPWYLTCKSKAEKEEYAVINNIFYFFNLIFKTWAYAILWSFFKGFLFVVLFYLAQIFFAYVAFHSNSAGTAGFLSILMLIVFIPLGILLLIIQACGIGKSLHRYWPSIHRTWRRINKRYWKDMLNQK